MTNMNKGLIGAGVAIAIGGISYGVKKFVDSNSRRNPEEVEVVEVEEEAIEELAATEEATEEEVKEEQG